MTCVEEVEVLVSKVGQCSEGCPENASNSEGFSNQIAEGGRRRRSPYQGRIGTGRRRQARASDLRSTNGGTSPAAPAQGHQRRSKRSHRCGHWMGVARLASSEFSPPPWIGPTSRETSILPPLSLASSCTAFNGALTFAVAEDAAILWQCHKGTARSGQKTVPVRNRFPASMAGCWRPPRMRSRSSRVRRYSTGGQIDEARLLSALNQAALSRFAMTQPKAWVPLTIPPYASNSDPDYFLVVHL